MCVPGTEPREALSGRPAGVQICLWTGTPPAHPSLPAPLRLPFPRHLLMIAVPVVYNYQFDKFRSSLLIIIISFHSVRLREFNNNINNGGRRSGIDYKELTGKTSFCCQETHPRRGTCTAASLCLPSSVIGCKSALGSRKQRPWPVLQTPSLK